MLTNCSSFLQEIQVYSLQAAGSLVLGMAREENTCTTAIMRCAENQKHVPVTKWAV